MYVEMLPHSLYIENDYNFILQTLKAILTARNISEISGGGMSSILNAKLLKISLPHPRS